MKQIYYYAMAAGLLCGTGCSEEPTTEKDGSIYGVVTDNTGNPVVAASVELSVWTKEEFEVGWDIKYATRYSVVTQTVTGSDGHYEFKNVTPRENYAIKVSSNGYQKHEQNLMVEAGKTTGGDVRLTPQRTYLSVGTRISTTSITKTSASVVISFSTSYSYFDPYNGSGTNSDECSNEFHSQYWNEHGYHDNVPTYPDALGCFYDTNSDPQKGKKRSVPYSGGYNSGTYYCTLTELTPNTTYYVQGFATNEFGTEYGNIINFTTLP